MASIVQRGLESMFEAKERTFDPLLDSSFEAYSYQKDAAKADYKTIDYTILSVVVTTLGLIIIVELIQHKLDHKAHGRLFFKTVLEAVYRELATLGIVEFFIFIVKKYYKDLNPGAKDAFADVHFMLFYAALFNAFQSVITAFFSTRVSQKMWVRTEQLELDHYIEIREEYERVDAILYGRDDNGDASERERQDSALSWNTDASANFAGYSLRKFRKSLFHFGKFVRYPHLCRQHAELLVQVRFHELRVHFLKANDLPLQLKVSEYLERCELQVLCRLVHISPFAWLLLTFVISVIYFLMSIVVDVTGGNLSATGNALTAIFLGSMVLFVLVSIVIVYKMKWIFGRIMRMKLWHGEDGEFRTGKQSVRAEKEISSQRALFWGNDPKYIQVMLQFMQFGFANALAVILVFSDDIHVDGAPLPLSAYILIVLSCYAAFVWMTGQVIPRYTLCTSLGQVVNQKCLQETVAEFHLAELNRKRQLKFEEEAFVGTTVSWDGANDESAENAINAPPTRPTLVTSASILGHSKTFEDLDLAEIQTDVTSTSTLLAELVETDTSSLRNNLIQSERRSQRILQDRMSRRKIMSEGVSSMRNMSDETDGLTTSRSDISIQPLQAADVLPRKRAERRKSSSADARMEQMQGGFFGPENQEDLIGISADRSAELAEMGKLPRAPSHVHFDETDSDDHSDVDDIPTVDAKLNHRQSDEREPFPSMEDFGRHYFASRRYHIISAVFGTMCCFFIVGHRMEALLLATGVLDDQKNTWGFPLYASFWLEVAYLVCFHIGSLLVLSLFWGGKATTRSQRALFASAILDIFISSTCLIVLFLAEAERCCDEDLQEMAGGDCCDHFGRRSYGGIGNIEPFTALVALRALRYPLAEKLLSVVDGCLGWDKHDVSSQQTAPDAMHPLDPLYDKKNHRDTHLKNSLDAKGTIVELWKKGIGKFPHVVESFGEFSGELLQSMLGVDIITGQPGRPDRPEKSFDDESDLTSPTTEVQREGRRPSSIPEKNELSLAHSKTGLTPIKEAAEDSPHASRRLSMPAKSLSIPTSPPSRNGSTNSSFIAPNARLIRSMRRCDRKLLPLLDQWMSVDVVMTKFEIVYFDASDTDGSVAAKTADAEAIRQAMAATHGGKGLRLQDVAVGRKVVGHLAISSIDAIHVERVLPHDDRHVDRKLEEVDGPGVPVQGEYWKTGGVKTMRERAGCWQRLKEDRLKIHSNHGTLYLRFYSDLEELAQHEERLQSEKEDLGSIFKNNALQWCQTLVRLCGKTQLHQKLPHYGQGDSDELRDFIEVADPNESHVGHFQAQLRILRHSVASGTLVERFPSYRRRSSLELRDDHSLSDDDMIWGRDPEMWA